MKIPFNLTIKEIALIALTYYLYNPNFSSISICILMVFIDFKLGGIYKIINWIWDIIIQFMKDILLDEKYKKDMEEEKPFYLFILSVLVVMDIFTVTRIIATFINYQIYDFYFSNHYFSVLMLIIDFRLGGLYKLEEWGVKKIYKVMMQNLILKDLLYALSFLFTIVMSSPLSLIILYFILNYFLSSFLWSLILSIILYFLEIPNWIAIVMVKPFIQYEKTEKEEE